MPLISLSEWIPWIGVQIQEDIECGLYIVIMNSWTETILLNMRARIKKLHVTAVWSTAEFAEFFLRVNWQSLNMRIMLNPRVASIPLRQCLRQARIPRQKKCLHTVLKLPYENLEPSVNGIYPVYSKEGFQIAWTERQSSLIDQVNRITQGTSHAMRAKIGTAIAHEDLFNLVVLSAKQPDMAPLFNYASSAWNNAFFFTGIVRILPCFTYKSCPKLME